MARANEIALLEQQKAELIALLLQHEPVETTLWGVVDLLGVLAGRGVMRDEQEN